MPAVIQTRSIKFGDGFIRDVDFLDLSGVGTGPWQPLSELTVGGALPLTYAFTGAGNTTPVQIKAGRGRLLAAHHAVYQVLRQGGLADCRHGCAIFAGCWRDKQYRSNPGRVYARLCLCKRLMDIRNNGRHHCRYGGPGR
jgi:hypothetical protein